LLVGRVKELRVQSALELQCKCPSVLSGAGGQENLRNPNERDLSFWIGPVASRSSKESYRAERISHDRARAMASSSQGAGLRETVRNGS
jgi:hypothetical protein